MTSEQSTLKKYFYLLFVFISIIISFSSVFGSEIQYLFPTPDTDYHQPETVIILRFWDVNPGDIINFDSFISVTGETSGIVMGKTIACADGQTFNFKPDGNFYLGERVSVRLKPRLIGEGIAFLDTTFHFTILEELPPSFPEPDPLFSSQGNESPAIRKTTVTNGPDPVVINGISFPSDFPYVDVLHNEDPDSGYVFISKLDEGPYNMIVDNEGNPIWYQRIDGMSTLDFKVQPDGRITMARPDVLAPGSHLALDTTYTAVDTFYMVPGLGVDTHDLQVLLSGNYYMIAYEYRQMDMSEVVPGGDPEAWVRGNHVVEMDAEDNPVFIWRGWDHYNIADAINMDLTLGNLDFMHMNAVAIDHDGNFLVSIRHLDEVTKVNRQTGQVMWRLGGLHNNLNWINDSDRISHQHDIRVLPNGHYTIFDNGNYHNWHSSRALELEVNVSSRTVSKVWEYKPGIVSAGMGNVQRLPNGNTAINWGHIPYPILTEVKPDGSKAFEMVFRDGGRCYRTFRFPWKGKAAVPYMILKHNGDRITLLFNKFGDPDVAYYNIYAGISSHPDQIITTTTQPFKHLISELVNNQHYYFRVAAVSSSGDESGFSNEEDIFVNLTTAGENLLQNGDFESGIYPWHLDLFNGAQTAWEITPTGELHLIIDAGGGGSSDIVFRQYDIPVLEGRIYQIGFDAHAPISRIFEISVHKNGHPWNNVSHNGSSWITPQKQHFTYEFVLNDPGVTEAFISLNAGGSNHDIYIDNITLIQILEESPPEADFTANITEGVHPLDVQFADQSTGTITSWAWDFGDGETSVDQHPSHVYEIADTFSVSLTVTGPEGSDSLIREDYIKVLEPPPVADFSADTTAGHWPFAVQFSDLSTGSVNSWAWNFGDSTTSMEQHPLYIYQVDDTFDVTLIATGPGGADTLTREKYIMVFDPPPVANFEADTTRGLFPLNVQFSDLSPGPITSWLWDFGDRETSIEQNPSHTFSAIDSFTVTLTVTGPGGADTLTRPDYIITSGPVPTAGFTADTTHGAVPFDVRFTDESIGLVDSWAWDFGDGQTSSIQHPVHSFMTVDTFTVRLIVSGQSGADTLIRPDHIIVTDPPPVADFTADTTTGLRPLEVQFTDLSTSVITSWFWDFGDSSNSAEQHPSHVYQTVDTFTVSLTAIGPGGQGTKTILDYITVLDPPPVANFIADTTEGIIPFEVQFTDQSTGTISSWNWEFGDEESSTEQNPTNTYQFADTFSVSLTVSGPGGEDTKIRTDYIITSNPSEVKEETGQIPDHFELSQNYPNPFNASTTIHYAVPEPARIRLGIYNVRGECVSELVNGRSSPGNYQINFDASELGSGLYFYRLDAESESMNKIYGYSKKMIMLK
ncbi:PKD domain-containing protein [candidate division KSB1 bacterium]|nr:PKD domain-containing protein [candidate division KSB1 bacterium]